MAATPKLTWRKVLAWRVGRQHLDERVPAKSRVKVAARLCGLHAQLMSSAELTLWARVDGLKRDAVATGLWKDRTLVKTWAMRGTLHLLPAAEFSLWVAAQRTRQHYLKPGWLRNFGITRDELDELIAAIAESLDGQALTREELAEQVKARTGDAAQGERVRGSWGAFLKPASFLGHVCFAPNEGQNVRFTSPTAWLGKLAEHDPDGALLEVARRYLGAYGPARREDLARWWGGTPAEAGRLLKRLGDEIVAVDVEGSSQWVLADRATELARAAPSKSVRLIPAFDQYLIGASRDAPSLLDPALRGRVYRPQGWISPVLLVDGRMQGVWRHDRQGGRLLVAIEPFARLPTWVRRAAEVEAERLARFTGGTLELRWTA